MLMILPAPAFRIAGSAAFTMRTVPKKLVSNWALASARLVSSTAPVSAYRSEEHTSELQSPCNLVCRLLLEKKNDQDQSEHPRADKPDRSAVDSHVELQATTQ